MGNILAKSPSASPQLQSPSVVHVKPETEEPSIAEDGEEKMKDEDVELEVEVE